MCEILPLNSLPVICPLSSFILNFMVSTTLHYDSHNDKICLIMVISDCKGGELVLLELGLILDLCNEDVVIFHSRDITHFNLYFVNMRVSIVCHTDYDFQHWLDDFNKWEECPYFSPSNLYLVPVLWK